MTISIRPIIIVVLSLCLALKSSAQKKVPFKDGCPCWADKPTAIISNNIHGHIPEKVLYEFLKGFTIEYCRNSAERSEGANDLLYEMLGADPTIVIHMLEKYPELNSVYLYSEISEPLTDETDVRSVLVKMQSISRDTDAKLKVELALRIALRRG